MIANTTPIAPQSSDDLLMSRGTQIPADHLQRLERHRADEHRREHGPERDAPVGQPPRGERPRHRVDRDRHHREQRREPRRAGSVHQLGEHDAGGEAHADAGEPHEAAGAVDEPAPLHLPAHVVRGADRVA